MSLNSSNYSERILTEQINPNYIDLDTLSTLDIVRLFSKEDLMPQKAVKKSIPEIVKAIEQITLRLRSEGRLFYIGAGTSGRLGVLDAAECPPTFCTSPDMVQGILAGGDKAIRKSSENLEDSYTLAIKELEKKNFSYKDVLIGISASGSTPYVLSALNYSNEKKALSISILL